MGGVGADFYAKYQEVEKETTCGSHAMTDDPKQTESHKGVVTIRMTMACSVWVSGI